MKLSEYLHNIGRQVAYYPQLRLITGSTTATILLCQFIYWRGKESDPNGWLYKSIEEIEEETGLSKHEQKTARIKLKESKLLEEYYARLDHQLWFRVDLERLNELWGKLHPVLPESGNPAFGKAAFPFSLNSNTENTQENTSQGEKGTENVQTALGTDEIAYELFKALKSNGVNVSLDKFKKIVRNRLNELDEGTPAKKEKAPMNNKEWNMYHEFPKELEPIIKKLEKGLGIENLKRDDVAIEVYRWVAEQPDIDRFIEWATSKERVQFVAKYRTNPRQIKNEWQLSKPEKIVISADDVGI